MADRVVESTTKAALINRDKELVFEYYQSNEGDPLNVVHNIMNAKVALEKIKSNQEMVYKAENTVFKKLAQISKAANPSSFLPMTLMGNSMGNSIGSTEV